MSRPKMEVLPSLGWAAEVREDGHLEVRQADPLEDQPDKIVLTRAEAHQLAVWLQDALEAGEEAP